MAGKVGTGSAMLVAVMVMCAISVLASAILLIARMERDVSLFETRSRQAGQAADAGIEVAAAYVADGYPLSACTLSLENGATCDLSFSVSQGKVNISATGRYRGAVKRVNAAVQMPPPDGLPADMNKFPLYYADTWSFYTMTGCIEIDGRGVAGQGVPSCNIFFPGTSPPLEINVDEAGWEALLAKAEEGNGIITLATPRTVAKICLVPPGGDDDIVNKGALIVASGRSLPLEDIFRIADSGYTVETQLDRAPYWVMISRGEPPKPFVSFTEYMEP